MINTNLFWLSDSNMKGIKVTQRFIKNYIATDITDWAKEDLALLNNARDFEILAYSDGKYGCNGLLFKDTGSDEIYKVYTRYHYIRSK